MPEMKIDLDKIFRDVVARYDQISPNLIDRPWWDMIDLNPEFLVRARQKPEEKKTFPDWENRHSLLIPQDISAAEASWLFEEIRILSELLGIPQPEDIQQFMQRSLSDWADDFNKDIREEQQEGPASRRDLRTSFQHVREYFKWYTRLLLAEQLNITLNPMPNITPLEYRLGL
jgi:hypothetical protein